MEIFRQIENHFANLESGQAEMTTRLNDVQADLRRVDGSLGVMGMKSAFMQEEMAALRGAFAGVEALLVANAAQMANLNARMDALEKRQPPAA